MGQVYDQWNQSAKAAGAAIGVTWPFSDQYNGMTAARFMSADYADAANNQWIDNTLPVRSTANNQFVYVLAPPDVQADSPQTMTAWQRFVNAGLHYGDAFADATGLPSLPNLEHVLNPFGLSVGKLEIGAALLGAVWLWSTFRKR